MGVVADVSQRAAIVPHIPRFHFLCDQLSDKGRKLLHRPLGRQRFEVRVSSDRTTSVWTTQVSTFCCV